MRDYGVLVVCVLVVCYLSVRTHVRECDSGCGFEFDCAYVSTRVRVNVSAGAYVSLNVCASVCVSA